jgi:predicted ester cyclase
VDELFAEGFVLHMPGREVRGADGVREMVTVSRNGFPDLHFTLQDAFAAGDRVVHRYTISGTHLADWHAISRTGRQISGIQGCCVSRLVEGQVAEMWELDDALSMLQQLGVVTLSAPMPSS